MKIQSENIRAILDVETKPIEAREPVSTPAQVSTPEPTPRVESVQEEYLSDLELALKELEEF